MEAIIKNLVDAICEKIKNDLNDVKTSSTTTLDVLIESYNTYQEEERDGVDYLFNLLDREDLACCVEGGLDASEIARLYNKFCEGQSTTMFMFGCNHKKPELISSWEQVRDCVCVYLDEIVTQMIKYPQTYRILYDAYITIYMEDNI